MKTGESVMATSFFQMLNSGRTATERGRFTYNGNEKRLSFHGDEALSSPI
ncbi:hypothetical protein HOLDEFILI_03155 [Holdemania filiformis DSM 12042]|uniref:Uncharacterized protein n=1 Tax=Holdemania filiformis DSM 12042 TaxID=545696 RepID=B9YBE8_9FIRM|nr:hypothetical protein HOLDEFILI_03155 [Holdemania filiformis DSM 12042]